jgi:hypothetical protein
MVVSRCYFNRVTLALLRFYVPLEGDKMTDSLILPTELVEAFKRGDVSLFIGAGLSMGAGLPGWIDLMRPLAQSIGSRWPTNELDLTVDHLLNTAQLYANQRSPNALISHIRDALEEIGASPTIIHSLVTSLPIRIIFTTNYDNLLERALLEAGRSYDSIVTEPQLAFWRDDRVQVIKLCGDLTHPTRMIITQRDFNTYFTTHPRLAERLRTTLESKTALFLGYSMQDPFFNQIWDRIGLDFGQLRRCGYAVLFDADPLEIDDLRQRGIYVINLITEERNKSLVLEQWLRALVDALPSPKQALRTKGNDKLTESENTYGAGNRWAVLVGVNEYEDIANYGRLQVCIKDAQAIQQQLIDGGFEPSRIRQLCDGMLEPPSRDNILVTLKAIADATDPDDLLLFYYSGHGDQDGDESYLVARNGRRLVLKDTAVSVSRVKEIMEQAPARAKVLILDACHSGADFGGKGPRTMSAEFIHRVFEEAEGIAILASCKQGQLSYEWRSQERSVFTHFLLKALAGESDREEKGLVTIQDVNRYVVNGVKLWASQNKVIQTPTLQYTVAGDIILCSYITET